MVRKCQERKMKPRTRRENKTQQKINSVESVIKKEKYNLGKDGKREEEE